MPVSMAGSRDSDTTILETPPYFLALLLVFFLVLTLGFEKVRSICYLLYGVLSTGAGNYPVG